MRKPRPPKHPLHQANDAAWQSAMDRREAKPPRKGPETVEEAIARGLKIELVPCEWTAPTRYPMPIFARGRGSQG